jgi:hypothetical protein
MMNPRDTLLSTCLLAFALLPAAALAGTESGFYVGGSLGEATVESDFDGSGVNFDESDTAWKIFGGYNFGIIPLLDLAIEGGYRDLGSPSANIAGSSVGVEVDGLDLFGLAGLTFGPFGVFAKAGFISWDASATIDNLEADDDGTDPAYGIGAKFQIGSVAVRGEFEMFDIDGTDDVYMWSLGAAWTF